MTRPDQILPKPTSIEVSANPSGRIRTSLADRWAIVGMTGTGKTTFTIRLIDMLRRAYPRARVYILDSKGDDTIGGYATVLETREAPAPIMEKGGLQVWRPPTNNREEYGRYFAQILQQRRPAIVVVDELSSIGSGNNVPEEYVQLLKQGRSLNISVITGTQEAAYIPRQVLNQTTHLLRFNLLDEYDGRKIDRMLRLPREAWGRELPDAHGFWYRRLDARARADYYRSYKDFFAF